jgi:hypothetical protein
MVFNAFGVAEMLISHAFFSATTRKTRVRRLTRLVRGAGVAREWRGSGAG